VKLPTLNLTGSAKDENQRKFLSIPAQRPLASSPFIAARKCN
jgi:hypothetical protein